MIAAILAAITAIFQAIPLFGKWLTKTPEQKTEDAEKDVASAIDQLKDEGRP